jgi:hypothetical protein
MLFSFVLYNFKNCFKLVKLIYIIITLEGVLWPLVLFYLCIIENPRAANEHNAREIDAKLICSPLERFLGNAP